MIVSSFGIDCVLINLSQISFVLFTTMINIDNNRSSILLANRNILGFTSFFASLQHKKRLRPELSGLKPYRITATSAFK